MKTNKMNILNRVFTRSMLRQFIIGEKSEAFCTVVNQYIQDPMLRSNNELIRDIYLILEKNYRNEYYYKNTLLNKLLLGIHSINTTTALTEVPIAKSKADFILINGKAIVYEIKTELDNLDRMSVQIKDYYKAFDHVAIVTYEDNLKQLKEILNSLERPIGIYVLRKNGKLGEVVEPGQYSKDLNKDVMFKILRKNEYENIIKKWYGYLPDVSQFEYYTACKNLFMRIDEANAYSLIISELKKRGEIEVEGFSKTPYELRFLAYFMDLTNKDYQRLDSFLNQRYGGV